MDTSDLQIEEKPLANPAEAPSAERYGISPDYLRAMGIQILRGRGFTELDNANAPLVALINRTAAERIWPDEDPIGKRIRLGGLQDSLRTIVGIVGDVNHYDLETAPDLQAYVPHAQWVDWYMRLAVRTSADPGSLTGAVRQAVHSLDPDVPLYKVSTMRQLISASTRQRRFTLVLVALFAAVALLMAVIGIYGVMAYNVTERTHEIAIRVAVGAQNGDVLKMVVGRGLSLAVLGVTLGLAAAFALTRLMRGLLFEVSATDPVTFAAIAALLASVALLACWIPARRATKVDPLVALRYE
jgi:putative ABC transport system permease protein